MKVFRPKESEPDGSPSRQKLRKGVADWHRRADLSQASKERYLEDLASVDPSESLGQTLATLCRPTTRNGRPVRALNPFGSDDAQLLSVINRGEFSILGFRNRDLKQRLFGDQDHSSHTKVGRRQSGKVTRLLTLLKSHHLRGQK